jgi:magnesium-transporting ATPase (P-type)
VLHEGSVQLSGEGTIHARATLITARAIVVATLVGFSFGVPAAILSTIWFTPQGGFDGWWTRLSEGFTLAGFPSGFLSWASDWRKYRRGRPLRSDCLLIAVLLIPTALCALMRYMVAMDWPK